MSSNTPERLAFHAERAANAAGLLLELFDPPCGKGLPPGPVTLDSEGFVVLIRIIWTHASAAKTAALADGTSDGLSRRDAPGLKSAQEPRKPRPRLEIVR